MPGRVDEVQVVDLTIPGLVLQRRCLCLDGDAPLFLDVHRVKHLGFHIAFSKATTTLDESVCQCRLTVVDVRNDGEISDVIHQRKASIN